MLSDVVRKQDFCKNESDEVQKLRTVTIADHCAELYGLPRNFVDIVSFEHAVRTELCPDGDIRKVILLLSKSTMRSSSSVFAEGIDALSDC